MSAAKAVVPALPGPQALPARPIDVSALMQDGVVVTLSIGRWRGMQKLQKEDIGLDAISDDKFVDEFLSLGKKTLIPPEVQRQLNAIEASARYAMRRYSFDTPFGFFVPAAAFAILEEEMAKWQKQWLAMRDQLVRNLNVYTKEMFKAYRRFAVEVTEMTEAERAKSYPKTYARRILSVVPTAKEIRSSFRFDFQVFHVPVPTVLNRKVRESLLHDERSERIRKMNLRIEQKFEREREQLVDGFLKSVNLQLRAQVFEVVSNVSRSIEKNDYQLVGKAAGQLRNLVERFRLLNFVGDVEIDSKLNEVAAFLGKPPKERDVMEIRDKLNEIGAMTRAELIDLGMPRRQVRELEFGGSEGDVTETLERRARRSTEE